ncbi:MAG: thiamine-binding protein [Flavobacteriaceae bacterium]|nr:thiamine-binding protein [Flavobacteriaceae bacterium]
MKISVELTLTPLQDNYEPAIIQFIKSLRNSGLTVLENPLSTQVYGDYDEVMALLQKEIKVALEAIEKGLLYVKIVKSDRSDYEPHF